MSSRKKARWKIISSTQFGGRHEVPRLQSVGPWRRFRIRAKKGPLGHRNFGIPDFGSSRSARILRRGRLATLREGLGRVSLELVLGSRRSSNYVPNAARRNQTTNALSSSRKTD